MTPTTVFDGHNDFLLRLFRQAESGHGDPNEGFVNGGAGGQLDLPRARQGKLGGGLCAIYIPSPERAPLVPSDQDPPLPPALSVDYARPIADAMAARFVTLARKYPAVFAQCRTAAEIRAAMERGAFAAVMHVEGAEMIGPDLDALYVLHAAGLRSLGPVWSRPNIFGHGVPFRFPSSPDTGPGLTKAGEDLVRACDELSIVVDLSHITEKGFWDVARVSKNPLVASHSNVHALSATARNLTDKQLDAIRERDGIVGLNYAVRFIRQDGRDDADTPLEQAVRHIDYLVERIGIDKVGLGSDFDGAMVPRDIADCAGLPNLINALSKAGYREDDLSKICHGNWLRVLEKIWGA